MEDLDRIAVVRESEHVKPEDEVDPVLAFLERVMANTEETEDGCLLWLGAKTKDGYAVARYNKEPEYLHRLIVKLLLECEIEPGQCVMHSCDCRSCVNLQHLSIGTHQQNMR